MDHDTEWPQPNNVKGVQSFLGFVNFYQWLIHHFHFSEIAQPLHALTWKTKAWSCGETEQHAFDALKHAVTSAPSLVIPSDSGKFRLECDASDFATGAVLSQLQEDRLFHPIGFLSKSLSDVERNYQIYDKEMLAIMRALEDWHHFLESTPQPFDIFTDHKNLSYFREAHKCTWCQARWSLNLSKFNFSLIHQPSCFMGRPDSLSCRPDHPRGEQDNEDSILLTPQLFQIHALETFSLEGDETTFLNQIWLSNWYDDLVIKALNTLTASGSHHFNEWECQDGITLYHRCVYVPMNPQLCHDLVHAHHNAHAVGHPGCWKTLELVPWNYWWPGLSCYIAKFITGCDICQRVKTPPEKSENSSWTRYQTTAGK